MMMDEKQVMPLSGLFDSHAHLNDNRFDSDREDVLRALTEEGIALCMCIGSTMESSAESIELANRVPYMYASVGVHPHDAKDFTEADVPQLKKWALPGNLKR